MVLAGVRGRPPASLQCHEESARHESPSQARRSKSRLAPSRQNLNAPPMREVLTAVRSPSMASGLALLFALIAGYLVARKSRQTPERDVASSLDAASLSGRHDDRPAAQHGPGTETADQNRPRWVRIGTGLLSAPMLGVLAGLLYALLLSAYDAYYQEFGLEPDDVGVSYLEVLSRSPVPLLYMLAICIYGLAVAAIIALIISLPVKLLERAVGERHRQVIRSAFTRLRLIAILGFALFAGAVTFAVSIRGAAGFAGLEATSFGETVHGVEVQTGLPFLPRMTVLEVKAIPAEIMLSRRERIPALGHSSCLLYLGTANGVHVLYDTNEDHALRIPLSGAAVVTDDSYWAELPDRCEQNASG